MTQVTLVAYKNQDRGLNPANLTVVEFASEFEGHVGDYDVIERRTLDLPGAEFAERVGDFGEIEPVLRLADGKLMTAVDLWTK